MITFWMMSSSGGKYTVTVDPGEGGLTMVCDCKAGAMGQSCKHKTAVITGDDDLLFNEIQRAAFTEAHQACQATSLPTLYADYLKEKKAIDREERIAKGEFKKRRNTARQVFSRLMVKGVQ